MNLASLLKKGNLRGFARLTVATVATDKPFISPSVATVATVNVANTQNTAATDPAPTPETATDSGELIPQQGDEVSTTAVIDDPDRWAWPHSTAMTGTEIDTFTARVIRFTDKGLTTDDGETLADKLVTRDRESDDRRLCLECLHLGGYGPSSWRCGNWQAAKVAHRARDVQLPADLVRAVRRFQSS